MKKTLLNTLILASLFFVSAANAQVGVGVPAGDIHPSAELEVKSSTKGFLPPRMTKAQRLAMIAQGSTTFPAAGLLVFQTDGDANEPTGLYFFDGIAWINGAGVQGIKGDRGETGAQGLTGATGLTGTQGLPGAQGKNTLAKTTTEAAGANCITGGVKIEYGFDANNSGTLDVAEINPTLTKYVCNVLQGPIGAKGAQGTPGDTGPAGISSGTSKNQMMYWNGSAWVTLNPGTNGQVLTVSDGNLIWTTGGPGKIVSLNCAGVSENGLLYNGLASSNVSFVITYTGGNGGPYSSQSISSTSVVGLTANLQTGSFETGDGSLTFTVSGTPTSVGNALFLVTIAGQVCSFSMVVNPSITDVENNTYKTVTIGTQQWMAENLKVSRYNDGTPIPNVTDNNLWNSNKTGAWSYYNNVDANNAKYGKLYNWYAVTKYNNGNKNVCPSGWHVPTDAEWTVLTDYLGGENVAGGKMKEVGTTSWFNPNTGATNTSLFSALPGGWRGSKGDYNGIGAVGTWWSSTDTPSGYAWYRILANDRGTTNRDFGGKKNGLSVRCLRD